VKQSYTEGTAVGITEKFAAIIRLTRWREHVSYTIPLVLIGALMAAQTADTPIDWRVIPVLIANILAMCFAFMINDLEDAPDDALNPVKRARNVISSGVISYREGFVITIGTFFVSLGLYALGGWKTLGAGGATLILCYLYSAKPFRLKARPVVDVLSHILMLAGLLMLSGYLIYDSFPTDAWFMIISVTLVSAHGQFYNQLDDFETDKLAGLNNTAVLVGERITRIMMLISITGAAIFFVLAVAAGIFPESLGIFLIIIAFTTLMFRWEYDMRGNQVEDVSGTMQMPVLVGANIIVLIWLAGYMGLLSGIV